MIVKATKPEQSRTRPATVTARKLLETNSSRMVHRLSRALLEGNAAPVSKQRQSSQGLAEVNPTLGVIT
jgi:hypothetical protein